MARWLNLHVELIQETMLLRTGPDATHRILAAGGTRNVAATVRALLEQFRTGDIPLDAQGNAMLDLEAADGTKVDPRQSALPGV